MRIVPYPYTASRPVHQHEPKEVREGLDCLCRFVMGSNKVLRVALGHGEEDEYKKGLSALAEDISGSIGLFFTRLPQDQVSILHLAAALKLTGCCERSDKELAPLAASWLLSEAWWSFSCLSSAVPAHSFHVGVQHAPCWW